MPLRRSILTGGLAGVLAGLFRPARAGAGADAGQTSAPPVIGPDDPRYERFFAARTQAWSAIGSVDDDVIAYLISPQFSGAPAWPTTRQSYRVVRPPQSLIIASDGLSDLFADTAMQEPGFGCEVYLESPDLAGADFAAIRASWQFALIENFAQNVADFGGINGPLDKYGIISMELPAPATMPGQWVTERGSVGVLINLGAEGRPAQCQLDEGVTIRLVALTTLLPDEVEHVISGGGAARSALAKKLLSSGIGLTSPANRRSVLA
jgi:hypothetical protein